MKPVLFAITCTLLPCLAAIPTMAEEIEEPAFAVVRVIDEVELREYAPTIQARTPMALQGESSSTFRRLANYIFGGNTQEQSIAMTAPVETRRTEDGYMAFTMPGQYRMEDLPAPLDDTVTLHAVPSRILAAITFGGWATDGRVARHTQSLLQTLVSQDIETVGPPSLNQYNPPWTPPWSRRNEVVIEVRP